jgi:hypothetical protein
MRENESPEFRGGVEKEDKTTASVGTEFCTILKADHVGVFVVSEFAAEFLGGLDADQNEVFFALLVFEG